MEPEKEDGLYQLLEIMDDHRQHMSDQCYIDLTDKLQAIFQENHGNFTTNYREMYNESEKTCNQLRMALFDAVSECFPTEIDVVEGSYYRKIWKFNDVIHRSDGRPAVITRYDDGITKREWYDNGKLQSPSSQQLPAKQWINEHTSQTVGLTWYRAGVKHRDETDGPAQIKFYINGELPKKVAYYHQGTLHRTGDLPAIMNFHSNGICSMKSWYLNGVLHRENGPAVEQYNIHGGVSLQEYYKHGRLHSYNGNAAVVCINNDTRICTFKWYSNGVIHRENGPSVIQYMNGIVSSIQYHHDGLLHREDGPAFEIYHDTRKLMSNWYRHGELIHRDTTNIS